MDSFEDRAEEAKENGDSQGALRLWKKLAMKNRDAVYFCRYGRVSEKLGN
jgi:hypothetical protein